MCKTTNFVSEMPLYKETQNEMNNRATQHLDNVYHDNGSHKSTQKQHTCIRSKTSTLVVFLAKSLMVRFAMTMRRQSDHDIVKPHPSDTSTLDFIGH